MLLHKTSTGNAVFLTTEFDYIFWTAQEKKIDLEQAENKIQMTGDEM